MRQVNKHIEQKRPQHIQSTPLDQTIKLILQRASNAGASHVHIEPRSGYGIVRLRINGILQLSIKLPYQALSEIVDYLKRKAGLEEEQHQLPQFGTYQTVIGKKTYIIETSTLPLLDGEYMSLHFIETTEKK